MAELLLVNPSSVRTYASSAGGIALPVVPSLGLASVGGAARDAGHGVSYLDLSYRAYDPDVVRAALRERRPDVVGVAATTPLINQARDISYLVREVLPDATSVVGGAHPTALPRETLLGSAFDLVATGEADFTLARVLDGDDPATIPGLHRREAGSVAGCAGALLDDLDLLPLPAWESYPRECLDHMSPLVARHRPMTTIEFSRGCIYSCDFCASKNTLGRGYRKKSPARCAEEMVRLRRLGFREALVVDDIFTTDPRWAAEVCEAIIASGVDLPWTCSNGIRVESADPELLRLMRRAGCYRVYFGFESGNDEVLRSFGKGGRASVAKGIEAVTMARDAGIEPNGFFLVGLTGDTPETMDDTIAFARRSGLDTMKCGMCVPFPGTPMFKELNGQGRIRSFDWDDYTVYNEADRIFEHPTLAFTDIRAAFRGFYVRAMLTNPAYLWRRLRFALRNGELWWTAVSAVQFWWVLAGRGRRRPDDGETYAYAEVWRALDVAPGDELSEVPVLTFRRRRRPVPPVAAARRAAA
jgi:anaerobic magnesium-protoporphyrin IX monomethyl ester cyclase